MGKNGILDPDDWGAFRVEARRMLDAAISQMQVARDRPWQPVPEDLEARYAIGQADQGDLVARRQTSGCSATWWRGGRGDAGRPHGRRIVANGRCGWARLLMADTCMCRAPH